MCESSRIHIILVSWASFFMRSVLDWKLKKFNKKISITFLHFPFLWFSYFHQIHVRYTLLALLIHHILLNLSKKFRFMWFSFLAPFLFLRSWIVSYKFILTRCYSLLMLMIVIHNCIDDEFVNVSCSCSLNFGLHLFVTF